MRTTTVISYAPALMLCITSGSTSAQFRLDQFTATDPSVAVVHHADGSPVWVLEMDDATILWCGDGIGDPTWVKEIIDPGDEIQLVASAGSSTTMVEAYQPVTEPLSNSEDLVTQRLRFTRIDAQGVGSWSNMYEFSFTQPVEFHVIHTTLKATRTADNGVLITVSGETSTTGPVCHLLRIAPDGSLEWGKRIGRPGGPYLMMSEVEIAMNGLLVTEYGDGRCAVILDNGSPPWDIEVHAIDAQGTPLASRRLHYSGETIYRRISCLGTTATGDLMIGGRMSTMESANIMTYRLDTDLGYVDGDVYWDFAYPVSPEMRTLTDRADGERLILVEGAIPGQYTYLINVSAEGNILSCAKSTPIPHVDDQLLVIHPHDARFDENGVHLAHALTLNHPGLGDIGHYTVKSLINPASPSCYFSPAAVQHTQIPVSLVDIEPLPDNVVQVLTPTITPVTSLADHAPIGTVQGCQVANRVSELTNDPLFGLVTNVLSSGRDLEITTTRSMVLHIFDAHGRTIREGLRLSGSGRWSVPLPELNTGVYGIAGSTDKNTPGGVLRFIVE